MIKVVVDEYPFGWNDCVFCVTGECALSYDKDCHLCMDKHSDDYLRCDYLVTLEDLLTERRKENA